MPQQVKVIREGLLVGLIAYAAVAVFYAAFDFLAARGPLFTVNLLGLAVFEGVRDPSILQRPIPLDLAAIFWYNALHLVFSLVIGFVVVRLIAQAQGHPAQAKAMLFTIVAGFVVTILAVAQLTEAIRRLLPFWSIVVANSLAVVIAARFLVRRHPGIGRALVAS
ncbi:MAG TPA: hypothetical protein PKA66_12710 [Gemmatimonadales bacterium]|nr:hypothetical protein [Gemmatimonadales bacterium]